MGHATDLRDKQWDMIEPIFRSNEDQHLIEHCKRDLINAVLYLVKAGCQWYLLPNDFPPYKTVFSFYNRAVKSGKWEKAMDLMVKKVREDAGRKPTPTYGLVDSQSAKQPWLLMRGALTAGKKSRVVSGILSLTQWVICLQLLFTPPTFTIQNQG